MTTLLKSAEALLGVREIVGDEHNPLVVAMHQMFAPWVVDDETPWCGAACGFVLRMNGYRTPGWGETPWHALRARYYLTIGKSVELDQVRNVNDGNIVVVIKRGGGPGPEVIDAIGHVGLLAGVDGDKLIIRGGNQSNRFSDRRYPVSRLLGLRRMTRAWLA